MTSSIILSALQSLFISEDLQKLGRSKNYVGHPLDDNWVAIYFLTFITLTLYQYSKTFGGTNLFQIGMNLYQYGMNLFQVDSQIYGKI